MKLTRYIIKKGKHYSNSRKFRPFFFKRRVLMFFIFTDSCRYEYKNNQIKEQINKLGGFGSLRHHKNSKRIGWRYNQEQDNIELYSYNYTKGVRTIEYIKSVEFNKLEKVLLHTEKPFKSGKLLFPYFGGKAEATKNTSIFLGFLI